MSRLRAFFLEEARECLEIARRELTRERPDVGTVHRAFRRLRGSAQMARIGEVVGLAGALEERLRPASVGAVAGGQAMDLGMARSGLTDLERALEAVRSGDMEPRETRERAMDGEGAGAVVEMEELEYRGVAALERALELRPALEEAVVSDAPAGPILEELFDLIRLGMG